MGPDRFADLIGREQLPPLIMALARLSGLPVSLFDMDGTSLASCPGPDGTQADASILVESGIHLLSLPVEIEGLVRASLVVGPYRSTGRRRPLRTGSPAASQVPILSRMRIEVVKARAQTLVQLLVDMGLRTLELRRERQERQRAEEALRAREQQYRSLVEQMNEGILAGDLETRITFVNPKMQAILGYTEEELLGKPFYELMDPELRAGYLARIKLRHTGVSETYETILNRKDGRKVHILISAVPLRDAAGDVIGSSAVMSDITERKQAERALLESESKFRSVFESMQDVFYRGDNQGRLTLISPSGARLLDYVSPEDLIGCDIAQVMYFDPPDRKLFLAALQERGYVRDFEVKLTKRDGTPVIVSTNSRLLRDDEGNILGVEGVFFDITERKNAEEALRRSEERYRLIVDNVQDIIFTHLPDGTISFVSGSVRHLGYTPGDVTGTSLFGYVHPEDMEVAREAYLKTITTLQGNAIEVRVRCKNGEYLWMDEKSDPVLRDGRLEQITCVLRDISERKSTEDALRKSEHKYARIINNIRDIVYSYYPDGSVSFVSESVKQMGYDYHDVIGRNLSDFLHPDDRGLVKETIDKAVHSGIFEAVECRLRTKDGSYVWVEANSEPIFSGGRLVQINGVARHITERKLAEQALRESEEKYRWLVEQLSEGIMVSDTEDVITFVNPRMAEMLGYTVQDMIGRKDSFLMGEEERQRNIERGKRRKEGLGEQYEIQLFRKEGGIVHFLVSGTPLRNRDGEIVGSFGVCSDITEWKRVEEELKRLSAAIEQTSDSIIISDTDGIVVYANPASMALMGIPSQELLGKRLDALHALRQSEAFYAGIWAALMQGDTWSGHLSNQRADGTRYETMTTLSPVRDRAGRIQYVVASSRDVTREAELEVQLRHSQRMEAIGVMAGGIAHDFNNILTPVMGYTEMALNRPGLDAKVAQYLREIASAGQRATELVQQILTFSRQAEQIKHPVQVDTIVKESLKLLRAAIPSTIAIRQRIGGMGVQTLGDASQIHQVVMNLCTNAFHAMRDKGGVMEVALDAILLDAPLVLLGSTLPPGSYLRLRVTDSGRGIDEETRKKIFLPFFTTKRTGEGTGLGLSIVHGIIVGMGGSIGVESEVGKGSTFTVYFPSIQELAQVHAPVRVLPAKGSERLMVVDDEGVIGSMLQDALAYFGYRVQTFESPMSAWQTFSGAPDQVDLVITDLTMPELTGIELAQRMWHTRPELPVILMTGYTESLDEDSAREAGFTALLRKPVSLSVIGQTVRKVLDRTQEVTPAGPAPTPGSAGAVD